MRTHPLWSPYEVPTIEEINAARVRPTEPERVQVAPPDLGWPHLFERLSEQVLDALGKRVLSIEHVGSTAVAGLWAKPIIDADLIVDDPDDEAAWLPDLEAAGFVLRVREPAWEQHRVLRGSDPTSNLHVWPPGAREPRRHAMFRDWLRTHPDDRDAYAAAKRDVAAQGFTDVMLYNNAKSGLIYDIYEKVFLADPEHAHDPHPRP